MKTWKDWTEEKFENFVYYIAADFVDKLEEEMEESGLTKKELAKRLDVSAGRVSQIFHNPGNLTLEMIVRCARAVGIKVAVLAYNDGDKDNLNGPIVPQVFYECWEKCGKPKNMFEIDEDVRIEIGPLSAAADTGSAPTGLTVRFISDLTDISLKDWTENEEIDKWRLQEPLLLATRS